MLKITIPKAEFYDEVRNEFVETKEWHLTLEHSLISISKWEAKWCKPFLTKDEKSDEEILDYIRCMCITPNVDPKVFEIVPPKELTRIIEYIQAPMTATWFKHNPVGRNHEIITSEIIYYWMITLQIPFECQKWHLNRLLTLIRVCNEKNRPRKKMGRQELLARQKELNLARRAQLHTKG